MSADPQKDTNGLWDRLLMGAGVDYSKKVTELSTFANSKRGKNP
jgi:hypothetical protein